MRTEATGDSSSALAAVLERSGSSISLLGRRSTGQRRIGHLGIHRAGGGGGASKLGALLGGSVDRLGSSIGLLELLLLDWRMVDVCDGGVVVAAALDAEDDKENPSNELANTSDDEHSNAAPELAHIRLNAVIVGIIVGRVRAVGTVIDGVGSPYSYQSTTDDEADDGGDEEADGPPLVEARRLAWRRHD